MERDVMLGVVSRGKVVTVSVRLAATLRKGDTLGGVGGNSSCGIGRPRGPRRGPATSDDAVLEFCGRLEVGLLCGRRRSSGSSGLVHTERKLHTMNGTRNTILARLTLAFFFSCTLLDQCRRLVSSEAWCLQFLDTPTNVLVTKRWRRSLYAHTGPSLCRVCLPCI